MSEQPLWEYGHGLSGIYIPHQIDEDGNVDFEVIVDSIASEEYARRIVACVNACRGIPTKHLEQIARIVTPTTIDRIAFAAGTSEIDLEDMR